MHVAACIVKRPQVCNYEVMHTPAKPLTFMEIEKRFVIPPSQEWRRTSVTLPRTTWDTLDEALEEINRTRSKPDRINRDQLIALYVDWADTERKLQARAVKRGT